MKHIQQKSVNICLVVLALLSMTSCFAPKVQVTKKFHYREASGRNIEPTQNAVVVPMVAHLEVMTEYSIEYVETFYEIVTPELIDNIATYKKIALWNATKKYSADTMVAALINVETNANGNLVITVCGYPARYKNFRSMKPDDQWILDINSSDYNRSTQILQ